MKEHSVPIVSENSSSISNSFLQVQTKDHTHQPTISQFIKNTKYTRAWRNCYGSSVLKRFFWTKDLKKINVSVQASLFSWLVYESSERHICHLNPNSLNHIVIISSYLRFDSPSPATNCFYNYFPDFPSVYSWLGIRDHYDYKRMLTKYLKYRSPERLRMLRTSKVISVQQDTNPNSFRINWYILSLSLFYLHVTLSKDMTHKNHSRDFSEGTTTMLEGLRTHF